LWGEAVFASVLKPGFKVSLVHKSLQLVRLTDPQIDEMGKDIVNSRADLGWIKRLGRRMEDYDEAGAEPSAEAHFYPKPIAIREALEPSFNALRNKWQLLGARRDLY
jgi:hypothetical protein